MVRRGDAISRRDGDSLSDRPTVLASPARVMPTAGGRDSPMGLNRKGRKGFHGLENQALNPIAFALRCD